jgi:hypothetical protein
MPSAERADSRGRGRTTLFPGLFLSIGAMKAGTSWLYQMLREHPDLNTTPVKEVHYFWERYGTFPLLSEQQRRETAGHHIHAILKTQAQLDSRALFDWFERYLSAPVDDAWFAGLFTERGERKYCAEFSNMSAKLKPEAWAHIRSMTEHLRIVYSIRSPVKRMWSHARFHAQVVGMFRKLTEWDAAAYEGFLRTSGCFEHGAYSDVLQFLGRNFDSSEYFVFTFEKIREDPLDLLRSIERFLDIRPQTYRARQLAVVHNAASTLAMPRAFAQAALAPIERELETLARLNVEMPPSWMDDLRAAQALAR